jgi:hypothetical protein
MLSRKCFDCYLKKNVQTRFDFLLLISYGARCEGVDNIGKIEKIHFESRRLV